MSKKGKHGVRNPKKAKPNPYDKRNKKGRKRGWEEDREYDNARWTRNRTEDDLD